MTSTELTPAVIAPECARGDCKGCRDTKDHPCEHNCHPRRPVPTSPHAEISAIGAAHEALRDLDEQAQNRAMSWLNDRLVTDRRRVSRASDDPWAREEPPF